MPIQKLVQSVTTPEGDGMTVNRVFPTQQIGRIDPFLLLDEMGPLTFEPGSKAGFPDHPHRGFETVTYLLDGEFEHKDSHGNRGRLGPGDVQWMTAGAGVVHSEMPAARLREKGGRLHGLQLWVNLPKVDKMMKPRYQEIPGKTIPAVKIPGGIVKVLAGEFSGTKAAIDTRTPIQFLHAKLDDKATVELKIPAGHEGFLYSMAGQGTADGTAIKHRDNAILKPGTTSVKVAGGPGGLEVILVTGMPLKEPVFQYGPFVMTTRDEIVQAVRDFQSGQFGQIEATRE
jgi:quercetin 2,3-dioxygenase